MLTKTSDADVFDAKVRVHLRRKLRRLLGYSADFLRHMNKAELEKLYNRLVSK